MLVESETSNQAKNYLSPIDVDYLANPPCPMEHAVEIMEVSPIICYNGTVFAGAGDARRNENLQAQIAEAKGEGRGSEQPVSWIAPFDHEPAAGIFETSHIEHQALKEFLQNPDVMTVTSGALSFILGKIKMSQKKAFGLEDSFTPPNKQTASIYSPVGNASAEQLNRMVIEAGGEMVMTSANKSREKEITTEAEIIKFKKETGWPILHNYGLLNDTGRTRFRSSYPIAEATPHGIVFVRTGFLAPELCLQVYDGLLAEEPFSKNMKKAAYPDSVLRKEHLPEEAQELTGAELRPYILKEIGVTTLNLVQRRSESDVASPK